MAQAGIHSMVGMAVSKVTPDTMWLMTGIVLGNLLPDVDNLAVAAATVAGLPTEGLHRTFTHSLITVGIIVGVFYLIAWLTKKPKWGNLGLGLGIGMLMHIILDLFIWFDGVQILWPFQSWVNLWANVAPPDWWMKLMMPAEFLFFALYFVTLDVISRRSGTDQEFLGKLRIWTGLMLLLFVVFTPLVYFMQTGFMTIYGALYLVCLGVAIGITIRMRDTLDTLATRNLQELKL